MSDTPVATAVQAPTIYFIDDSATMREVIKIAFRKENIQVVTCPSVSAAIEQFGTVKPDAVISDVIMPDRDGYELCTYIKGHAELGKTPVILMSGVVNRAVAEKATVVGANELLRKPFQPQELVARVKKLLPGTGGQLESQAPETASAVAPGTASAPAAAGMNGLEKLFSPPAAAASGLPAKLHAPPAPAPTTQAPPSSAPAAPKAPAAPAPKTPAAPPAAPFSTPASAPAAPANPAPSAPAAARGAAPVDVQRLRFEIQRLELLVKKLQSELEAERQYCQALEAHLRTLEGAV